MDRSKRWKVGFLGVAFFVVLAPRVRAQAQALPRERLVEAAETILEAAPRYPEASVRLKRLAIELDRAVTTSGGEPMFLDSCRLAPKPLSAQSFLHAKEAVAELVSLTRRVRRIGSEETPAPSLVRLAKEVLDEVLEAYLLIADVAIQEARARAGNEGLILDAEKALLEGIFRLENRGFQSALAEFDKSWHTSQRSIASPVETGDPPLVNILTPRQGNVLAGSMRPGGGRPPPPTVVNVTGMVQDLVQGSVNDDDVDVFVNGKPATVVNRSYQVNEVPLRNGLNALLAVAVDADGNAGFGCVTVVVDPSPRRRIQSLRGNDQLGMIGTSLPMPLVAGVVDEQDQAVSGATVVFRIVQGDGSIGPSGERIVAVTTDASGEAMVPFQLGSRAGVGLHRVRATATGYDGEAFFCATATGAAPQSINPVTGDTQTGVVSSGLPRPLVAFVTDAGQNPVQGVDVTFRVMLGGGLVNGMPEVIVPTNSDGRAHAIVTLGPDPGLDNNVIEASFAGLTREPATFRASAFVLGPPEETRIAGVVLDNQSQPVPGVTLSIHGGPPFAQADAQGQFLLTGVPVGHVVLEADGSTATRPGVWAGLLFELNCVAGAVNTLPKPIYLLPLDVDHGKIVGGPTDETITIPAVEGFSLKVLAGSATFPDGSRTGLVSVTPVTADKIPMPPGSGMQPRVIVTIQPDGALFNPPAPVTYPNVDGLPPGMVTEMFSFDHELGEFVSIGTGTVSQDGTVVASDPGFGIVKGGWHCSAPQSEGGASANLEVKIEDVQGLGKLFLLTGETLSVTAMGQPSRDAAYRWTLSAQDPSGSAGTVVSFTSSEPFEFANPPTIGEICNGDLPVAQCPNASTCAQELTAIGPGKAILRVALKCCPSGRTVTDEVEVEVASFYITNVYSEQLPGRECNRLPPGPEPEPSVNVPMLVGAVSGSRVALSALVRGITASNTTVKVGVRQAGDSSTFDPASATLALPAPQKTIVDFIASEGFIEPRVYELIAFNDTDGNDIPGPDEEMVVFPQGVRTVTPDDASEGTFAIQSAISAFILNGLAQEYAEVFLGSLSAPFGATTGSSAISLGQVGLSHPTGATWSTTCTAAVNHFTFASGSVRSQDIAQTDAIEDEVETLIARFRPSIDAYFDANPSVDSASFPAALGSPVWEGAFTLSTLGWLPDLQYALSLGTIIGRLRLEHLSVARDLFGSPRITEVRYTASFTDLNDYNYFAEVDLLLVGVPVCRPAAIVQAGYPTMGGAGAIFLSTVEIDRTAAVSDNLFGLEID